jgi:hypothetical protein
VYFLLCSHKMLSLLYLKVIQKYAAALENPAEIILPITYTYNKSYFPLQ